MIKIKTNGPWKRFVGMTRGYPDRVRYVEERVGTSVVNALVEKVRELAPKHDEFEAYIDSLMPVKLSGDRLSFGVISKKDPTLIGDLSKSTFRERTVVYINPSMSGNFDKIVSFLSSVNPWPIDLLPHGMDKEGVVLIHRIVSDDEASWARKRVLDFVSKNDHHLRRNGLRWGKVENESQSANNMTSMPDYMWIALRSEFGINANHRPHWKPAIRWVIRNISDIVKKDQNIEKALNYPLFRKHTIGDASGLASYDKMRFKSDTGNFQEKIVK